MTLYVDTLLLCMQQKLIIYICIILQNIIMHIHLISYIYNNPYSSPNLQNRVWPTDDVIMMNPQFAFFDELTLRGIFLFNLAHGNSGGGHIQVNRLKPPARLAQSVYYIR